MGIFKNREQVNIDPATGERLMPGEIIVGERYGQSTENWEVPKAETAQEAIGLARTALMVFAGIDGDMYKAEGLTEEEITETRQFSFECKLVLFGWRESWGEKPSLAEIEQSVQAG